MMLVVLKVWDQWGQLLFFVHGDFFVTLAAAMAFLHFILCFG